MSNQLKFRAENVLRMFPIFLYYSLCLLLLAGNLIFVTHDLWVGDFWHHAAIVRELMLHPFTPQNPFFAGPPIPILYWPYEFAVSLFAGFFNLAPQRALSLWGFVNLILLFLSLDYFISTISSYNFAATLSLLFVMLFWGANPLLFSSYYSLDTLFLVSSYPSTFAFAIALLTLGLLRQPDAKRTNRRRIAVVGLTVLVFLSHPLTFLFLASAMAALIIGRPNNWTKNTIFISFFVALIVAYFWPYLPLGEILFSRTFSADPNGRKVYEHFLMRYWPALAAIPIVILRLKEDSRDFLSLAFVGLSIIYLFGFVFGIWNFGRAIAFVMFLSQIMFAEAILRLYARTSSSVSTAFSKRVLLPFVFLVLYSVVAIRVLEIYKQFGPNGSSIFLQLSNVMKFTEDGATVLASETISMPLPSFGRKIVVFDCPPFFGGSFDERRRDVRRFFDPASTFLERKEIIKKYSVSYLLLDTSSKDKEVIGKFRNLGEPVYEDRDWLLQKVS